MSIDSLLFHKDVPKSIIYSTILQNCVNHQIRHNPIENISNLHLIFDKRNFHK